MSVRQLSRESHEPQTYASKAAIVDLLRSRITAGTLCPGEQLPTRDELRQHFGTTRVTVQRAFDMLSEQGFVQSDGRRGTFVATNPPHLARFALVFSELRTHDAWPQFWTGLCDAAVEIQAASDLQIPCFYSVDQHLDSEDARRLLHEFETHQLAGAIFTSPIQTLTGTALLRATHVPKVAIVGAPNELGVPIVRIDYDSFFDRALDYLADCGRRRVAVINPTELAVEQREHFGNGVAARGMETQPYWWLSANLDTPQDAAAARTTTHLLMNANQNVRPDALIVANDNLLQHVVQGLQDAGVRVPLDVEIVAHANFPVNAAPAAPMRRLGYPPKKVLQECIALLLQQSRGEKPPILTEITALFEHEVGAIPAKSPI